MEDDSNSHNDLLPINRNIKRNGVISHSNNILLLPTIGDILRNSDIGHNDLLPLPKDFYFQWMALFRSNSSKIYREIIYFLIKNKICYVGGLARVLGKHKQNIPLYLDKLKELGIIRIANENIARERIKFLRLHKAAFHLKESNFNDIKFYELTHVAQVYFSAWNQDFWEELLDKSIIKSINEWQHKLSKTHKQIKKQIKKEEAKKKEQLEKDAHIFYERKYNPLISDSQQDSWIEAKAEKYGLTSGELIKKFEKIIGVKKGGEK